MRLLFVHTRTYAATAKGVLSDSEQRALEDTLLTDPEAGDVVARTGGARKVRVALAGRGKRSGARVLYAYVAERARVYLLLAYPKNVQGNLTDAQRAQLRGTVSALIREG